jgi:hypothetical protein
MREDADNADHPRDVAPSRAGAAVVETARRVDVTPVTLPPIRSQKSAGCGSQPITAECRVVGTDPGRPDCPIRHYPGKPTA